MDVTTKQLERNKIMLDLREGRQPSRVPVLANITTEAAIEFVGGNLKEVQWNLDLLPNVLDKCAEVFHTDGIPVDFQGRDPYRYQVLDSKCFIMNEAGFTQHPEVRAMEVNEYDEFIKDPYKFMVKILPRLYSALNVDPELASIRMTNAYYGHSARMMKTFEIYQTNIAKYGYITDSIAIAEAPFDFLTSTLRSFTGISSDIRRNPQKVVDACEAILPIMVHNIKLQNPKCVFVPLHMAPFIRENDFDKIWWPTFKKMIDTFSKMGMSKIKMILFLTALFLSTVAVMADMVIVPAVASMYTIFADKINLVNYIVSGPQLITIFSSLLCGKLMQYMSKKSLLIIGFGLFAVASIFGISIENAIYIATMRTLVGASMGIVNVAAVALLAEIFIDEKKRSTMMGIFNGAMAAVGALIGLIAGFFAVNSWQSVFKVYLISIPIFLLIILFIPKTPAETVPKNEGKPSEKKEPISIVRFGALSLSFITFNALYMGIFYQLAVYVIENNIGNESTAGLLASVGTLGSAFISLLFGIIYNKFKRGTIIPTYAIMALSFIFLTAFPNLIVAIIINILMGFAFGNAFSYFFMRSTIIVPPSQVSTAIGIITAVSGIGMFISTYMITILQTIMGISTLTGVLPVLAGFSVIATVLSILLTIRNKKHPSEYVPKEV